MPAITVLYSQLEHAGPCGAWTDSQEMPELRMLRREGGRSTKDGGCKIIICHAALIR